MKTEDKIFIGAAAIAILGALGYVGYSQIIDNAGNTNQSDVAFSSTPDGDIREKDGGTQGGNNDAASYPETLEPQKIDGSDISPYKDGNGGTDLIQDPEPVPPAERDGSDVAQALRKLRLQDDGIQQRLTIHGETIRSLQQQVNDLKHKSEQYQESLDEAQHSNDALREDLSGKNLYSSTPSGIGSSDKRKVRNHGYQLTNLFDDQAWIKTPEGRTYIVGEGDWFGDEYVISINGRDHVVTTTVGDLAL